MGGVFLAVLVILCSACVHHAPPVAASPKIELNLAQLDNDGLRGPPGGKVSLSYEFSIPNTEKCRGAVKAIDPSIQFMPGSAGRMGAGKGECLCIGTTGKGYRDTLRRLAALPFVKRIIECHFE